MIEAAWRWITKTRRRGVAGLLALLVLLGVGAVCWREFCLWQAHANLILRQDAAANLWLGRSFPEIRPDSQICLIRSKLARRSGRFHDVPGLLAAASRCGAPTAEVEREQALAMAQTSRFETFTQANWARLMADPRDDEPEIAKAYVTWAASRFQFGEADRMLNVWEQDYPADPEPPFQRGRIYAGMSNWESAERCYRRALELAPHRADIQSSLASTLKHQLQLDEAIHWYQESLRNEPTSCEVKCELAQSLLSRGDLVAAKQAVEDGLQRHPDDLDLLQSLGEIYLADGDASTAVAPLQQVHAARPESASLAYLLASALQAVGRTTEAQPLFAFVTQSREPLLQLKTLSEQMIQQPANVEVRFQIATITARYKSRTEAKRWFVNLLQIDSKHRPSHLALAELYHLDGDEFHAAQHRQIAASLPP